MDIEPLADACGGLAWISGELFEVEGRLAAGSSDGELLDARLRALLARSSRRHGQHAQWWRAALPDSPALAGFDRVRPPTDAWVRLLDHIVESAPAGAVAALFEVALPQLIFVLEHLSYELSPVSDGNAIRIVAMVTTDLTEEESEAKQVWPMPKIPSSADLEALLIAFSDDYREKRWPPLLPHPRRTG
ncbi:hypothetical protein [Candidatus Poriferisocius sp.]|uniref:hypothetical protein n=1 Tax=Candidatus Poriferisocius sp. TaxID=3101276 RepID=UPI003B0142D0